LSESLRRIAPRPFAAGLLLIAAFGVIETVHLPEIVRVGWTLVAAAATVIWPLAGLTVMAALGPFVGALEDDGRITAMPFLLAALGAGVILEAVRAGAWRTGSARMRARIAVPVLLALALMAGTALGVLSSLLSFGPAGGRAAAELWVPGIGGAMTVFVAAAWVGRAEALRLIAVVATSVAVAASVSMLDFFTAGGVNATALGWMLRDQVDTARLGGIILAPNAAATIFVVGVAVSFTLALFDPRPVVRALASVSGGLALVAALLTYSRSALLALVLISLVLGWRWRGRLGVAAVAVVGAALAAPYALIAGSDLLRAVPGFYDQQRLDAWSAAIRIWADHPLTGAGFRAFEWLHETYGSALDAPHNEWLRFFAEEGTVVGLAGLVFAASTFLFAARGRSRPEIAGAAAWIAVVAMASFNNVFMYTQVNVPVFMVAGIGIGVSLAARAGRWSSEVRSPAP
jgi:O-antigen ligase